MEVVAAAEVAVEAVTNGDMEAAVAAAVEVEATVETGAETDMTIDVMMIAAMMIDVVAVAITKTMAEINVAAAVAATNMDRNGTKTTIQAAEVYANIDLV